MAYLHCHSCDWSQDDFWSKKYNSLTKIWDDIKWLWKPRMIGIDAHTIKELIKYTYVPIIRKKFRSDYRVFSWNWLMLEFVKEIRILFRQKWWTYKSWKKYKDTAFCPKCGMRNFDID